MLTLIHLLAPLALAAQAPPTDSVAPFVGEDVAAVVRVDLAHWEGRASIRRLLGGLADDPDTSRPLEAVESWAAALKKAGASDLFVLIDPADMPGLPVAVVPLAAGADPRAIAEALSGPASPVRWPKVEEIRGAAVAGTPAALARIRGSKPAPRPELAEALAAGDGSTIRLALIPSLAQRRAIEESFPTLPEEIGGAPIETLTRGMAWASVALTTGPSPTIRLVVRARDAGSASALREIAGKGLELATAAVRANPETAGLAPTLAAMKPEASGDRLTLEADPEKTVALLALPVRELGEGDRKSRCTNNLKQIALAMHNYLSANNTFPPAYVASKDGKPLLSWRVLVLPYLEEKELFDQFHLDEPWDSPHNKALIPKMPKVYACPDAAKRLAAEGKTTYLAPRGTSTLLSGPVGSKIQDVTDGTSNTIMAVDAGDEKAVIWTRPDDWDVPAEVATKGLFGHHKRGTNFVIADGSVRLLKETIAPALLKALTTKDGGEVINQDDF